MSWAHSLSLPAAAAQYDPNALSGSAGLSVSFSGTLIAAPGPTEVVFTDAGGAQIVHYEDYDSSGDYVDAMGVGSTFNQPNAGNRPAVDTSISPAGRTMLSCDGNDLVGDFGTGGIIDTADFPAWSGTKWVVEHFILYLPSSPDNSTVMRMIDCGSDSWGRNFFGSGLIYKSGAVSDSAMSGSTPYYVTIEHNVASGVSTLTVDGVAQTTTGSNSSSTRTDYLGYKLIGANGALSQAYVGYFGGYGIGWGTTWTSTERAALYQAQQDWFNGVSAPAGDLGSGSTSLAVTFSGTLAGAGALTGSTTASVTPAGTLTGSAPLTGATSLSITLAGTLGAFTFASGSVPVALTFTGALAGTGALTGSTTASISPAGTLSGAGTLTGAVPIAVTPAGTLAGAGALTGNAPVALTPAGTLTGSGALAGALPIAVNPAGALTGAGALAGSTSVSISPAGTLTGAGALTGTTQLSVTPAGTLAGSGALTGSVSLAVNPAGTLTGAGALTGSTSAALTFVGTLSSLGSGSVSGSVPIAVSFSGTLAGVGALTGTVPVSVTPSGLLTGAAPLTGSTTVSLTLSGTLTGQGALSGSLPISVIFDGDLENVGVSLEGSVPVELTFSGELQGTGALTGAVPVSVTFSGTLQDGSPVSFATITWTFGPATVIETTAQTAEVAIQFTQSALAVIAETQQLPATVITIEQTMTTLYVGDTNDIDFEFRDGHSNALVDPTALEISVQAPSETEPTVYVYGVDSLLTKRAVGQYRAAISCTEPGVWLFTIRSPGPTGKSAKPGVFDVEPVNT